MADHYVKEETAEREPERAQRGAGRLKSPVDFDSLLEISREIIGWLKVEALDISYPVAQGEDNDFYLHHTFPGDAKEYRRVYFFWTVKIKRILPTGILSCMGTICGISQCLGS